MSSEITIRLSQAAKDQLAWLKRHTGLTQWNELCRWGLALSLRDPSTPLVRDITTDSNVEISWRTFAGPHGDVYLSLLKQRCAKDGEEPTDAAISKTLLIHLHRGIGYLAGRQDLRSIQDLITITTE
ncbi:MULTISPECIES: DNA sulfur modification protein DndE [unclassified Streptomyces]|uniref:DNA sulfur modification protein DndE n=1 Tax=unclassified Streptomyces TaxID=2593676 RepID=UPI000886D0C4|nr:MULTISPECIES: DNA sulfur modification protein DndE [unclassified Streptomyces]PBC83977.1 DNA sulfur modification protein DndE [Streptomyces sp. 2321.6]SDR36473.1 DNA sulfur modification protein DndE [Streptomyces sp. KS_16]SED15567.1 DNA sulfur modification protein DndE [Streptomyces sp. 2133.1]SNC70056.1 DNA sulfur modification protein DndE [Streptomyces sp. 2114.4]